MLTVNAFPYRSSHVCPVSLQKPMTTQPLPGLPGLWLRAPSCPWHSQQWPARPYTAAAAAANSFIFFVAAKTPIHSCDQSFIQQNVLSHYYVLGRGPDAFGVTHHFRAWNYLPTAFPALWALGSERTRLQPDSITEWVSHPLVTLFRWV